MSYCAKCGADIGVASYCLNCGYDNSVLENTPAHTPQPPYIPTPPTGPTLQTFHPEPPQYAYPQPPISPATQYRPLNQPVPQQSSYQEAPQFSYQQTSQQAFYSAPPQSQQSSTPYPRTGNPGLFTLALVFMILGTIVIAIFTFGIGLLWCIPMTVHTNTIKKGKAPNTTGFGVCCLLFVGVIGGILLLIADKDQPPARY